jgi:hypothetical protein
LAQNFAPSGFPVPQEEQKGMAFSFVVNASFQALDWPDISEESS